MFNAWLSRPHIKHKSSHNGGPNPKNQADTTIVDGLNTRRLCMYRVGKEKQVLPHEHEKESSRTVNFIKLSSVAFYQLCTVLIIFSVIIWFCFSKNESLESILIHACQNGVFRVAP